MEKQWEAARPWISRFWPQLLSMSEQKSVMEMGAPYISSRFRLSCAAMLTAIMSSTQTTAMNCDLASLDCSHCQGRLVKLDSETSLAISPTWHAYSAQSQGFRLISPATSLQRGLSTQGPDGEAYNGDLRTVSRAR